MEDKNTNSVSSQYPNILMIDDNPAMSKLMTLLLKRTPFAASGITQVWKEDDLRKVMSEQTFDLILIDNLIPPYTTFRDLLTVASEIGFDCPVVLLSGAPPKDLYSCAIDDSISGVWNKDDLSSTFIEQALCQHIPAAA